MLRTSKRVRVNKSALAAAILGAMAAAAPFSAALAQQDKEVQRAEQATQQQSQQTFSTGGMRWAFKPYVESEAGYDSNPDNSFDEDGTSLLKLEAGFKATAETESEFYKLAVRGRFIDYHDLPEDIRHRADFRASLDTTIVLSKSETLYAGTYFLRDLISLARADIGNSYLEYALKKDDFRVKLQAKSHVEHNFDNDSQLAGESFDNFSVSRARAFDYARSDGQINVLTFTRSWLQPFAIFDYGNINYYNQVAGASIDRDANEFYAIGGIRLQPASNFRIDAGYRYNYRDMDDQNFSQEEKGYIDLNVFWKPIDTLKVTGIVERHFDEPSSSFGIVEDVKSYGTVVDWDFARDWRLTATGFYDREETVGVDRLDKKYTGTLAVTHYTSQNMEVFLSTLFKHVEEDFTGDSYNRYKVGAGVRLKF